MINAPFAGDLVFVELDDANRAQTAVLRNGSGLIEIQLDWSKANGCYLAFNAGACRVPFAITSGAIFWAADDFEVKNGEGEYVGRGPTRRLETLPAGMTKESIFEDAWELVAPSEYCAVCDDYFPDDGVCSHLVWTESGVIGAGTYMSEGDEANIRASLVSLVDTLGVLEELIAALRARDFQVSISTPMVGAQTFGLRLNGRVITAGRYGVVSDVPDLTELLYERQNEFRDGFGWLSTLDPKETPDAIARTLEWLESPVPA